MDRNHPTDQAKSNGTTTTAADPRLTRLQRRLLEAFDELWDNFVDPADALYDVDGSRWTRLGGDGIPGSAAEAPYADPQQLGEIRAHCRALAVTNEFAINGHENRISYVVGAGHTYRVTAKKNQTISDEMLRDV